MPTLSDIKEIFLLRYKIFTIRFFPLFLSIIILFYIVSTDKLLTIYFIYSILVSICALVFSNLYIRFNQKIKYIINLNIHGDFIKEYHILNQLENEPLWESEKFTLDLNRAKLFYDVGNYKRFIYIMDSLTNKIDLYPKEQNLFSILKSFYFEINNDFPNALKELENLEEKSINNREKILIYNNIGRLQITQNNFISAQIFYEKSFNILKINPRKDLFPIVIHNLLIIYAKNNEKDKANELFEIYWELIDKTDAEQILHYTNDMTHYSRQIDCKDLINKSFEIVKNKVYPIIKSEQRFSLDISNLRISYNDNIDFENTLYDTIEKTKLEISKGKLTLENKLLIISEFKHVLTQFISTLSGDHKIYKDLKWLRDWHLSLEPEILEQLNNIESSLSNIRTQWLNNVISLEKSKIIFPDDKDYLPSVKFIVSCIDEKINILDFALNDTKKIHSLIQIMDEIVALIIQTRDLRLEKLYNYKIKEVFSTANQLLEENWQQVGNEHFMIGIAWFSYQIIEDKDISRKWLNRFDNLNHSIKHYAQFIQDEYINTKYWLDE